MSRSPSTSSVGSKFTMESSPASSDPGEGPSQGPSQSPSRGPGSIVYYNAYDDDESSEDDYL